MGGSEVQIMKAVKGDSKMNENDKQAGRQTTDRQRTVGKKKKKEQIQIKPEQGSDRSDRREQQ